MNPLIHFEIHADNLERAKNFYKEALGWQFQDWPMEGGDPYIAVMTKDGDSGINGGLVKRPTGTAPGGSNAFVCTASVKNYDETAAKIISAGGKIALDKFAIAGMAWQGYFIDTEGNTFGIHEPDSNAR